MSKFLVLHTPVTSTPNDLAICTVKVPIPPDAPLIRTSCPVIILQGNMEKGAIMSDAEVEYALTLMPHARHVYLEGVGHNLGLYSWEVGRLLQLVNTFLESIQ